MLTLARWQHLMRELGAKQAPAALFDELLAAYSSEARAYHNATHIADGLEQWDIVRELAQEPAQVEAAIWYHDVVYDSQAKDNEEQSAAWAKRDLFECGVSESHIEEITSLILITKHTGLPQTLDQQLLVDVDLSILGREEATFDAYDLAIRSEYAWVPEPAYTNGRKQVLESFLNREAIFSTPFFRDKFEVAARANLRRAIDKLNELASRASSDAG
jgi:predicted metal-dependent HD superfamily phosphohydrolase